MSEKQVVYAVTYGEYSDWSVHSLHSTRERAQAVVDRMERESMGQFYSPYDNPQILEWEVDAYEIPQVPQGMHVYRGDVYHDGRVEVKLWNDGYDRLRDEENAAQEMSWMTVRGDFGTILFARDDEHARKITTDRRARYLAEQEGVV